MIPTIAATFTLEDVVAEIAGADSPGDKVGVVVLCTVTSCVPRVMTV
jgi:hypothetical protein